MKCKIDDKVIEEEINLDEYEKACEMLLMRIRKPIERALKDASIKVKDIDEIILVGGATKLPIVRSFVAKLFGRLPNTNINPDEAVALGAAVQAAMKERNQLIKEIVLTDVCPYTLGTNVSVKRQNDYYESGHFFPIIDRNTVIPVSRTERLYTLYDNQSKINVEILQGERLYEESVGERREEIDSCLRKFEDILDTQDRVLIEQAYKEVKEFFDNLEDVF